MRWTIRKGAWQISIRFSANSFHNLVNCSITLIYLPLSHVIHTNLFCFRSSSCCRIQLGSGFVVLNLGLTQTIRFCCPDNRWCNQTKQYSENGGYSEVFWTDAYFACRLVNNDYIEKHHLHKRKASSNEINLYTRRQKIWNPSMYKKACNL